MLHSVVHLRNLRSLQWAARGMTIHVDDILRVLQACPRLVSLSLGVINVVYMGHDSTIPSNELYWRPNDRPGPLVPIPDTDLDTLYSGHQLQKLEFDGIQISDEALLRLLGIDMEPVDRTDGRSLALIYLDVNSAGPTHKSGARILQECGRLEVLKMKQSRIASVELFQGNATWACAPVLKQLILDIKPLGMDLGLFYTHHSARWAGLPVYTATEQRQIWNRLQSMTNLRHLGITGYPIDLAMVEDMSFAKQLEFAYVHPTIRVPHEQIESEKEGILALADAWVSKNPQGWSCRLYKGTPWIFPKLEMTYRKEIK
ncbi:hypothetical protein BG006_006175 [Podila minutissima]|uniref:Uncharacterized protein n=1 Tax=Podila minutissima TaxID=64525 RepID=A0A9P5SLH9_9FUNG|nr:hypothetical protein BG006_006175 [Podila minutissima]